MQGKSFEDRYASAGKSERKKISESFNKIWSKTSPQLFSGIDIDLKDKKILIVDDAVHSGKTLDVAKKYLLKFKPDEIKTAALFYVDKYLPDYFIGKGEMKYPWSSFAKFEKGYWLYRKYLEKHNYQEK